VRCRLASAGDIAAGGGRERSRPVTRAEEEEIEAMKTILVGYDGTGPAEQSLR
jgi:hypothetical protein